MPLEDPLRGFYLGLGVLVLLAGGGALWLLRSDWDALVLGEYYDGSVKPLAVFAKTAQLLHSEEQFSLLDLRPGHLRCRK